MIARVNKSDHSNFLNSKWMCEVLNKFEISLQTRSVELNVLCHGDRCSSQNIFAKGVEAF